MSTRGHRKLTGAVPAPVNPDPDSPPAVVVARQTRGAKAKAPAARKTKVVAKPAKKQALPSKKPTRVPKADPVVTSDEESDSSQLLEKPESLAIELGPENDSQLRIEQLRKQLAELEANQESRNPLKRNLSRAEPE